VRPEAMAIDTLCFGESDSTSPVRDYPWLAYYQPDGCSLGVSELNPGRSRWHRYSATPRCIPKGAIEKGIAKGTPFAGGLGVSPKVLHPPLHFGEGDKRGRGQNTPRPAATPLKRGWIPTGVHPVGEGNKAESLLLGVCLSLTSRPWHDPQE